MNTKQGRSRCLEQKATGGGFPAVGKAFCRLKKKEKGIWPGKKKGRGGWKFMRKPNFKRGGRPPRATPGKGEEF